jgi:hypothetical protein
VYIDTSPAPGGLETANTRLFERCFRQERQLRNCVVQRVDAVFRRCEANARRAGRVSGSVGRALRLRWQFEVLSINGDGGAS